VPTLASILLSDKDDGSIEEHTAGIGDVEMEDPSHYCEAIEGPIPSAGPLSTVEPAIPPLPSASPIILSDEQESIVQLCESGESLFFTGSAGTSLNLFGKPRLKMATALFSSHDFETNLHVGTGKSVCLREIIRRLRNMYGEEQVFVTASTGTSSLKVFSCSKYNLGDGDN
jgi:hypothetical protein